MIKKRRSLGTMRKKAKSIKDFNKQEILKFYIDNYKGDYYSDEFKDTVLNLKKRGYKAYVNTMGQIILGERYVICEYIEELTQYIDDLFNHRILNDDGEVVYRIYISIVSQAGKSTTVSERVSVYAASVYGFSTLTVSYDEFLSKRISQANKNIALKYGDLMGIRVKESSKNDKSSETINDWVITRLEDGYDKAIQMQYRGFNRIEGLQCEVLILDDLINYDTSRTPGQRKIAYEKYQNKLVSRRPKYIIMIGTRYNDLDLYNTILNNEKGLWNTLIIPVFRDGRKPLGWERGWDENYWAVIRLQMGEIFWQINAMCDTSGLKGLSLDKSIFKNSDIEYDLNDIYRRVVAVDGAQTQGGGDFTTFICCDVLNSGEIIIVGIEAHQCGVFEGYNLLSTFLLNNLNSKIESRILIERANSGIEFINLLLNDENSIYNKKLYNFTRIKGLVRTKQFNQKDGTKYRHSGNKNVRYERNFGQLEYGKFYYLDDLDMDCVTELINQTVDFDTSNNNQRDDLIDVLMSVVEDVYTHRVRCMIKDNNLKDIYSEGDVLNGR